MTTGEKIRKIADHYSFEHQTITAIEELSELQRAICRWNRGGMTREIEASLIDEIADVLIMVRQLEYLMGAESVSGRIKEKLDRKLEQIERG